MILQNWWYTTLLNTKVDFCQPLMKDISCEVLVVGGGMAGLHAALKFAQHKKRVVLLERNICGGSSTGKSAGFLTPDSELELSQLMRRYGKEGARVSWGIPTRGVELIVSAIKTYRIKCDLLKLDSLFVGIGRGGLNAVKEEARSREELNFPFTFYDGSKLKSVNTGIGYYGGVRYGDTYAINPLLYAQELKSVLIQLGVRIYESTEVMNIGDHKARTHLGSVKADQIIVCIDKMKPSFNKIAQDVYHAQTFLAITEPLEDKDTKDIFPTGNIMCWDSRLVYSYYRLTASNRLLLGGGSALTTFSGMDVTTPSVIQKVIDDFKARFPSLDHLDFIQYWPGRIDTTKDIIPIVDFDRQMPYVQYVLGCVGLPWAAFCGDWAAGRLLDMSYCHPYCGYFKRDRWFLIPSPVQNIFGKMLTFSLNNAYSKYLQRDKEENYKPPH